MKIPAMVAGISFFSALSLKCVFSVIKISHIY